MESRFAPCHCSVPGNIFTRITNWVWNVHNVHSIYLTPPLAKVGTWFPLIFTCRQEVREGCGQKGGGRLVSQGRRRQAPRQRCLAACKNAGPRAAGGAGGSTGDSEPAPDGLSRSAAEGGRYTCVQAPAATGQPPASTSSGSGDQQLSDNQHPTTTVTTPISNANTMYTSAFPVYKKT